MAKKVEDYTNRTFGALKVKEKVIINNRTYWNCICKCGKERIFYHNTLKQGYAKSCGCRITFKDNIQKKLKKYCTNNTYIPKLKNATLNRNNTSGYRGVSYRKDRGKYRAYIKFQGRDIFLGNFDDIDDAIKARQEAEKEYFGQILDKEN